ncbi:hypothetical protein JW964_12210 [candidate division KSB1 bacterium]|nr:hypothetical protein [candidate division KSB1 bacterium]
MKRFHYIFSTCLLIFLSTSVLITMAKESRYFGRTAVGFEIGSWKPNSLKADKSALPFGVEGASPFLVVFITSPQLGDWTLRGSCGYWAQANIQNRENLHSANVVMLMVDLKERILSESRLTPFVSYGISFSLGSESPVNKKFRQLSKDYETGYGVNVGAGFDLSIFKNWALTMEFCYHYIVFNRTVGLTDDYSGPKINAGFFYTF